ncbi:hypothetical protein THAOC_00185, partial [Thalassiosira oceanica]
RLPTSARDGEAPRSCHGPARVRRRPARTLFRALWSTPPERRRPGAAPEVSSAAASSLLSLPLISASGGDTPRTRPRLPDLGRDFGAPRRPPDRAESRRSAPVIPWPLRVEANVTQVAAQPAAAALTLLGLILPARRLARSATYGHLPLPSRPSSPALLPLRSADAAGPLSYGPSTTVGERPHQRRFRTVADLRRQEAHRQETDMHGASGERFGLSRAALLPVRGHPQEDNALAAGVDWVGIDRREESAFSISGATEPREILNAELADAERQGRGTEETEESEDDRYGDTAARRWTRLPLR